MEFSTYIFDLDGTLLDTLPDLVKFTNKILKTMGFPPRTTAEIQSFIGNGQRVLLQKSVPADAPEGAAEEAYRLWNEWLPTWPNDLTKPYPHMEETLAALKEAGVRLGVVSNKQDLGVHITINQFYPGVFDFMMGAREDLPRKPDPTGLLDAIGALGASKADVVYIGDSPRDVTTSRNAGVASVAVSWGYHERSEFSGPKRVPDWLIDDPRDLLHLETLPRMNRDVSSDASTH